MQFELARAGLRTSSVWTIYLLPISHCRQFNMPDRNEWKIDGKIYWRCVEFERRFVSKVHMRIGTEWRGAGEEFPWILSAFLSQCKLSIPFYSLLNVIRIFSFLSVTGLRFGAKGGAMLRWMCETKVLNGQCNVPNWSDVEEWRSMHILRVQCRRRDIVIPKSMSKCPELSYPSTGDQRLLHILWVGGSSTQRRANGWFCAFAK